MPVLKNNIDDTLQEIKFNYDFLMQRNKNLKEENELLKSEHYKDKEIQRLIMKETSFRFIYPTKGKRNVTSLSRVINVLVAYVVTTNFILLESVM